MTPPYMLFEHQWHWIKSVWRVITGIFVGQLLGMAFGIQRDITGDTFFNLWYGGACATPIGFLIGAFWHLRVVPSGFARDRSTLLIIGAFCVALPVFALATYDTWLLAPAR